MALKFGTLVLNVKFGINCAGGGGTLVVLCHLRVSFTPVSIPSFLSPSFRGGVQRACNSVSSASVPVLTSKYHSSCCQWSKNHHASKGDFVVLLPSTNKEQVMTWCLRLSPPSCFYPFLLATGEKGCLSENSIWNGRLNQN